MLSVMHRQWDDNPKKRGKKDEERQCLHLPNQVPLIELQQNPGLVSVKKHIELPRISTVHKEVKCQFHSAVYSPAGIRRCAMPAVSAACITCLPSMVPVCCCTWKFCPTLTAWACDPVHRHAQTDIWQQRNTRPPALKLTTSQVGRAKTIKSQLYCSYLT